MIMNMDIVIWKYVIMLLLCYVAITNTQRKTCHTMDLRNKKKNNTKTFSDESVVSPLARR